MIDVERCLILILVLYLKSYDQNKKEENGKQLTRLGLTDINLIIFSQFKSGAHNQCGAFVKPLPSSFDNEFVSEVDGEFIWVDTEMDGIVYNGVRFVLVFVVVYSAL
jgi:hypothetical protein